MLSRFGSIIARVGQARAQCLLLISGIVVGMLLAAGASLLLADLRRAAIAEAKRNLLNLSFVLAEEADRNFQALDLVQRGVIEQMQQAGLDTPEQYGRRMASLAVHQNLRDRIGALSHIDDVALYDRAGRLVNFSKSWPIPTASVADRAYFRTLRARAPVADAATDPTSLVSGPLVSRISGAEEIVLAHRYTAADGTFLGAVVGSVSVAEVERMFQRIAVGGGGSITLVSGDGDLMARFPPLPGSLGLPIDRAGATPPMVQALRHTVLSQIGILDGKRRLIAPHELAHYPLIVTATDTLDDALAGWRHEARSVAGATAFTELVLAGFVVLGLRHVRSYETLHAARAAQAAAEAGLRLAQERERGAQQMRRQWHRFDAALSNMHQGLVMFDDTGRILVANSRFRELCGLPADLPLLDLDYRALTECVVAAGAVNARDMAEMRERRRMLVERREEATFAWELASGRAIMVTHRPMEGGGWLTTYEDITERREAEARIAYMARHDALTGLPNRALFHESLEAALARARRGRGLALLCLDLDQFKHVNDTLGHPVGDALLQAVAQRLSERARETDTVARLGGDEFAVVLSPIDKLTEATGLAERLNRLLEEPFEVAGHQIVIGTSIGIAFAPQDGLDPDQLLKNADLALYRAKLDGRGIYRLFHAEMDARMQARRLLELDLRQALRTGQLELFYQPLIELKSGSVTGLEALLRWRHPQRGIVPPSEFIPLTEEIGLIVPIGEWVLREACRSVAGWSRTLRVSVNLSPVQFKSRNLVAAIAQALAESGLPPHRLELEITETVMLQDTEATVATLQQIHDLGARIALDDFGTGYSSLSYLRRFPFDRIKIDQSFVRELDRKPDCTAIVHAVAGLGAHLGMATTAEGVETPQQVAALARAGCVEGQGYLFSRAVPADAVPALLRSLHSAMTARAPAA